MEQIGESANRVWLNTLTDIFVDGYKVSSPNEGLGQMHKPSLEIIGYTSVIDMNKPIVTFLSRKLNYKFMFAEALWILSGSNNLEEIAHYGPAWRKFSDDGKTLSGAYGPEVISQLDYVINTLLNDPMSRQAVLTTWKKLPKASKDIPCTVSTQFLIRGGKLHIIHNMRSSDTWVGWPYDIFCFTCVAWYVMLAINMSASVGQGTKLKLGNMHFRAGSQHIYLEQVSQAQKLIGGKESAGEYRGLEKFELKSPSHLMSFLRHQRDNDTWF